MFVSILRTLVLGVVAFFVTALATYQVALWVRPPRTSSGHPTMVIGQAMAAIAVGAIGALLVMYSDRRWQRRRRQLALRALERGDIRSR